MRQPDKTLTNGVCMFLTKMEADATIAVALLAVSHMQGRGIMPGELLRQGMAKHGSHFPAMFQEILTYTNEQRSQVRSKLTNIRNV